MASNNAAEANKRRLLSQHRSDLPLVTPDGKPVRREGPKWDAKRINHETQFILGTKACRLLGKLYKIILKFSVLKIMRLHVFTDFFQGTNVVGVYMLRTRLYSNILLIKRTKKD